MVVMVAKTAAYETRRASLGGNEKFDQRRRSSTADEAAVVTALLSSPVMAPQSSPRQQNRNQQLDHLGRAIGPSQRVKSKTGLRTLTLLYDRADKDSAEEEVVWKLLLEARRVLDASIRGLWRLYNILRDAARSPEHSLLGEQTFRLAMLKFGARDPILISRLFDSFCEATPPGLDDELARLRTRRIDFRHFLRVLASVNEDPVEKRLELLLEVWDADASGTLTYAEIAAHASASFEAKHRNHAMATFQEAWKQVKQFSLDTKNEKNPTCATVLEACQQIPLVMHFFTKMLTREPPFADESMRGRSLYDRCRQLDAEVKREVSAKLQAEGLDVFLEEEQAGPPAPSRLPSRAATAIPGSRASFGSRATTPGPGLSRSASTKATLAPLNRPGTVPIAQGSPGMRRSQSTNAMGQSKTLVRVPSNSKLPEMRMEAARGGRVSSIPSLQHDFVRGSEAVQKKNWTHKETNDKDFVDRQGRTSPPPLVVRAAKEGL